MPVLPWFGSFWKRLSEQVLSPRVDSAEVEQQLRRAREKLPQPVIWLLGKTQSGKSSLVRALTGSSDAEIGNGFRPCTRTARLYAFPSEEQCLVRFLDTRGLGEVNYDPSEDIAHCQRQSHLLIVTVRAMDHALQPVVDAVAAVRKAKRDWPTVVVQTALHEGYPPGASHPQPYPFEADVWDASVPDDLARSLRRQREEFAGLASRFVPVDFTLPEDELPPQYYGEDCALGGDRNGTWARVAGPVAAGAARPLLSKGAVAHLVERRSGRRSGGGAESGGEPIVDRRHRRQNVSCHCFDLRSTLDRPGDGRVGQRHRIGLCRAVGRCARCWP